LRGSAKSAAQQENVIRIEPRLILDKSHRESRKTIAHRLRLSEPALWGQVHRFFSRSAQPTHPDKAVNGSKSYAFVV
jgi:hypothetical protein